METRYGIDAVVVGEIVPYSIADESTGAVNAGLNLRIPGDVVKLSGLDPATAERMNIGETWRVTGRLTLTRPKGQPGEKSAPPAVMRITEVTHLKRLARSNTPETAPTVDWGDNGVTTQPKPAATKGGA